MRVDERECLLDEHAGVGDNAGRPPRGDLQDRHEGLPRHAGFAGHERVKTFRGQITLFFVVGMNA